MRGRRRKPDYGEIDRLEHDLGLDDETVLARRTKKRVLPKPVILSPRSAPLDVLEVRPGVCWPVDDPSMVSHVVSASAVFCSSVHSPGMYAAVVPVSRVVLPPGVGK